MWNNFSKKPLFLRFFVWKLTSWEFSDCTKLNPDSQIKFVFSSKKLISLKKSNFSSKYIEFLFNIFDPSPIKIKIQLSLFWKKALKYSSAKFNLIISSTLAKITFFDKSESFNWLLLSILF